MTDSVENCNYLTTEGGGRARLSVAHSDVPFSNLHEVANTREEQQGSRVIAEKDARFLPAGHDTASNRSNQDTLQNVLRHEHDSLLHSAP